MSLREDNIKFIAKLIRNYIIDILSMKVFAQINLLPKTAIFLAITQISVDFRTAP